MICKNCNHEIPQGAMFCTNCGTPVAESAAQDYSASQPENNFSETQPAVGDAQPAAETSDDYFQNAARPAEQQDFAQPQQNQYHGQPAASEQNPYVNQPNPAANYGAAQGVPQQPVGSPYVSHYGEPINNGGVNARYNEQYRQTYNNRPPHVSPNPVPVTPYNPGSGHVGVGAWIGVMILNCIPLVNWIMLFVWAFGSGTKPSLKNYARASLIIWAIALALLIIVLIIFLAAGVSIAQIFSNSHGYYYYYY